MWCLRFVVVAALGLPLAGCFGLPPKELPPWAMSPQAAAHRPDGFARPAYVSRGSRTAAAVYDAPTGAQREVKPFSPEWQARENALDGRLRRSMSICGGC
jgi:hypothetical protein